MNAKIERVIKEIEKTKGKIAAQQARLRDLEKQKTNLENEEIVALFRREKLNEDDFAALLRGHREETSCTAETPTAQVNLQAEDGDDDAE